jgi:hypothetical protein
MTPCNESLLETPCTAEDGVISLRAMPHDETRDDI